MDDTLDPVELVNELGELRVVLTELVDALDDGDAARIDAAMAAARPHTFEDRV